jgi:hypothetical protein
MMAVNPALALVFSITRLVSEFTLAILAMVEHLFMM